jgi:hypothetical protein
MGDVSKLLGSPKLQTDELELAIYLLVLLYSFAIKGYTIYAEVNPTFYLV